jgi:hypothetical protein
MAGKRAPYNSDSTGSSLARRALVGFLTLAVVAGILWGVRYLGDLARRNVAERDRYTVLFADIECDAPPGYERAPFLSEVRHESGFPATLQSIDPELSPKLTAAFASHPWVAKVDEVLAEPEGKVRVKLRFRVPALAVHIAATKDQVRVVDTHGVLLPLQTDAAGLARLVSPVPAPTTPSGKPWADDTVKRAVELLDAHHPKTLEKTAQGWRLTLGDGKVVVVEK